MTKEPKTLTTLKKRKIELEAQIEKYYLAETRNFTAIHHSRKTLALTEMLIKELEREFEKAQKLQAYKKPRWEIF